MKARAGTGEGEIGVLFKKNLFNYKIYMSQVKNRYINTIHNYDSSRFSNKNKGSKENLILHPLLNHWNSPNDVFLLAIRIKLFILPLQLYNHNNFESSKEFC